MKTNKIARIVLMALVAVAVFYYGLRDGSKREIVIISTNDVHAFIDNMPKMMTLVKQLKAENENVLILDAGDRWTGNPYVDQAEQKGKPIVDLMNMIGYDYFALGNHEFDYMQSGLKANLDDFEAKMLCANADFSATELAGYIDPYVIFELDDLDIAIVSFVQLNSGGIPSAMPAYMEGIEFQDGVALSQEYRFLRDSADLVIALTHLGFTDDSLMVVQNDMFDLVVGGHSHTYIPNGMLINGTLVTQAGEHLNDVGITRITVEMGGKVSSVVNEVVSLSDIEPDAQVEAYIQAMKDGSPLNDIIGELDIQLDETGLVNMTTDIIRLGSKADIALQNVGGVRLDSLVSGPITISDVCKLEPFSNHIVTQKMTLDQIKAMILNTFNTPGDDANRIDLYPSGMKYEVILDANNKATDVKFYDLNGRPMADRTYTMATSNYVSSAYKYECSDKQDGELITTVIIDALESVDVYKGSNVSRATITKN